MTEEFHCIKLKRVYDDASEEDGIRLLADRLWPRGIKKENLQYDRWIKDICPSTELRKKWHHAQIDFETFRSAYEAELQQNHSQLRVLCQLTLNHNLTLLSAVKDIKHSHLPVLRDYLYDMLETFPTTHHPTSPVCYQSDIEH